MSFLGYIVISDRVAETCEDCNLEKAPAGVFSFGGIIMTNMEEKPFLTYKQQVKKLKDKELKIEDEEYVIWLLKKYSYFDLISGYKEPFKRKDGKYKANVTIEDIYALYCFDDKLRALILRYILKIEKHIKSLISYSFCKKYGEDQGQYMNVTNFNYTDKIQEEINKLVNKISHIINHPDNYVYIRYQKEKYGNVPLWVMMKAITLGTVSKLYSFLQPGIQSKISREFAYVNEGMLIQMLNLLARVRNVCAHNERLYDYKYRKGTISDTEIHMGLKIKKEKGQYGKGKNDLFAVVIVFRYLLEKDNFIDFIKEFEKIFNELLSRTRMIQKQQMHKYMGFPDNWVEIKNF